MNKNLKPIVAVAGVSLALSLAFTGLVGCNDTGDSNDTTLPSMYDTTTADPNVTSEPDVTTEETTEPEPEWTEVNETVYVTVDSVNLREGPGKNYDIVGNGKKGDSYTRVKYSEGWSLVVNDGEEFYVSSDCLSTENSTSVTLEFNNIDTTVTVNVDQANLRTKPSSTDPSAEVKYVVTKGTELVAIGVSIDGKWYKINYKDSENKESILYVSASIVDTETELPGSDFTAVTKQVKVLVDQLSIRTIPSIDEASGSIIVAVAVKDQIMNVIGVSPDGKWYMIKYTPQNGTEGNYFISAGATYVADVEAATTTEANTTEAGTTEAEPTGTTEATA